MAHRWALSAAEYVVLWTNGNENWEEERQANQMIVRTTLPKVTTARLCDITPEAG